MTYNSLVLMDLVDTGMSAFQIEHFVINEQLTPYRQVRQALIELKARIETKALLEIEIEELEIKILQSADVSLAPVSDHYTYKLSLLEIRKYSLERDRKMRMVKQLDKEASLFDSIVSRLVNLHFTDVETFALLLNTETLITSEEEQYWEERLAKSAVSDLINYNTLSKGTVDALLSLPKEMQTSILNKGLNKSICLTESLKIIKDLNLAKIDK